MTPERAHETVKALEMLADVGREMRDELEHKIRWLKIDDGQIFFNNEYTIEPGEAVEMALLLLGYARVLRKL